MFIPSKQYFSFPPDVIKYLWKNPLSATGTQKLYQTCKYFYSKQEIVVFNGKNELWYGKKYHTNCLTMLKIDNINVSFWFHDRLLLHQHFFFDFTRVYRCTIKTLHIVHKKLTFTEFKMLVRENTVKDFSLAYGCVLNFDNSLVPVDTILTLLPNIYYFEYLVFEEKYSLSTLMKMMDIKFFNQIQCLNLILYGVSETFDPLVFCNFINQNVTCDSTIKLSVGGYNFTRIEPALEICVNEMLQKWKGKKPSVDIQ